MLRFLIHIVELGSLNNIHFCIKPACAFNVLIGYFATTVFLLFLNNFMYQISIKYDCLDVSYGLSFLCNAFIIHFRI